MRRYLCSFCAVVMMALFFNNHVLAGTVIYVDSANIGSTDGASWGTAYTNFQQAVDSAVAGDSIFVAKGTYQPASGTSFSLKEGVKIFGCFAGTESHLAQRDLAAGNNSILKGNGAVVIDNSSNNLTGAALLNGFVITGGSSASGGGMYNSGSSPTLTNVVFYNNTASSGSGGGMYNNASSPVLTNVVFSDNSAPSGSGGGMYNSGSTPTLTNVTFSNNGALSYGGAIGNASSSSCQIANCVFWGDTASADSDIYNDGSSSAMVTYSYAQTAIAGTGNIHGSADPFFNDALPIGADGLWFSYDDGLQPANGSPIIDMGNNSSIPGSDTTDIIGNTRIHNGTVDMGAFEHIYNAIPLVNSCQPGGQGTYTYCYMQNGKPAFSYFKNDSIFTISWSGNAWQWAYSLRSVNCTQYNTQSTCNACPSCVWVIQICVPNSGVGNPTIIADNTRNAELPPCSNWVGAAGYCAPTLESNCTVAVSRYYVDSANVNGTHDGSSWATAYNKFEDGVNAAVAGDTVFVAKGTYQPAGTFSMKDSVKIYGGFAGTESSLTQRDLSAGNNSILKGIGAVVIDNSSNNLTAEALLDGFIITGGIGYNGGGMDNVSSSPTLRNLIFSNDSAVYGGDGGGMYNSGSSPVITNVIFSGNTAPSGSGGGIYNTGSSPVLTNVSFSNNSAATGMGGAIYDDYSSSSQLVNCVFWGNTASSDSEVYNSGGLVMTYSYTQTAIAGTGNIHGSVDPFVNDTNLVGADGVYMTADDGLQLPCGSPAMNAGDNSSIPSGDSTDITGAPRILETTVDMGAYESTKPTSSSVTETACDSLVSPSGKYTWKTSGTYMDTIPNAAGCDSMMTFNLTIAHPTASSQTIPACDSLVSPSGKYTWKTSGNYMDTIPNAEGCDSVMTINLTIHNATSSSQSITACDSYTSPSGNYTWTTSGTYNDTIPNAAGCDSVMTINLTIDQSTSSSQTTTVCDSMMWHGMTYTVSGTYNDTIPNAAGCDSVMTLNLTINHSTSASQTASACSSYTWNGMTYASSGAYIDTLSTSAGCDSIVTLNLTISSVTASASQVGDSLVASPAGAASYQWVDCNNGNAAISGATGQSYTPSSNGSYAVIITEGSCTDTSTCATYVMTGINNIATNNYLKVYPNPSMGSITISSDLTGIYYLVNELGQRIEVIELTNANHKTVSISGLSNGIYTLVGNHNDKIISKRIVVTK